MRKIVTLVAALLAFMAFTSVAQANTTDSCIDFGSGQNNCFTSTSETNVDFGTVHMGRFSAGTFTLVCTK
jgi:type 1 fimbria pilin